MGRRNRAGPTSNHFHFAVPPLEARKGLFFGFASGGLGPRWPSWFPASNPASRREARQLDSLRQACWSGRIAARLRQIRLGRQACITL